MMTLIKAFEKVVRSENQSAVDSSISSFPGARLKEVPAAQRVEPVCSCLLLFLLVSFFLERNPAGLKIHSNHNDCRHVAMGKNR